MKFEYHQPTKIVFGPGRITEAGVEAKELGSKALIVTVPLFDALKPGFDKLKASLQGAGLEVRHFDGVVANPTKASIDKGAAMAAEEGVDVVIGFGGGSSMDTAKAIAVGAVHPGSAWDYLFFKKEPTDKTLPVVAVSTTSGTG
ncbi:MAG: iron-containing alcohol dehydrogenase, partial [Desulfobacterales bacterium]|nr:iron-containing alcohol dehydrogenase [Desulfobacterales bacterium]